MTETNLREGFGNSYWRATDTLQVYARVATTESNTYVGSSKALGTLYRLVEVQPGDEIHALVGGTFLIGQGPPLGVRLTVPDYHPFERAHRAPEVWPLDKLEPLDLGQAARVPVYPTGLGGHRWSFAELEAAGATVIGRGIDWMLPVEHGALSPDMEDN